MSEGRIALVTGASQGIGEASARALAAQGWTVVMAARRIDALDAAIAAMGEAGARCIPMVCDVADPAAVDALYAGIEARCGRLDLLFNNAGALALGAEIGDLAFEDWRASLSVNVDGAFLVARGAYRMMRAQQPQGGRIINNGSISAHAPRPRSVAYTTAKHAITGLTKSIALDGRAHRIACSQIDIGNAATPMTARMSEGVAQADGSVRAEPRMDVAHVADAVAQMAALPLDANVLSMTIMATGMPFVGRG